MILKKISRIISIFRYYHLYRFTLSYYTIIVAFSLLQKNIPAKSVILCWLLNTIFLTLNII